MKNCFRKMSINSVKYGRLPEKCSFKSDSQLPKKNFLFDSMIVFKNDEKCFLSHLKNSFCSQDIYIFVLNFWQSRKNGLI